MIFNEDSRVKIPSILHLIQLGYTYLSLKDIEWDENTNIFKSIFIEQLQKINPNVSDRDIQKVYDEVSISSENEDLGRAFYNKLIDQSGVKLIDFENFDNNSFHVVTELPYQKDEETFRPDITLLINGMPLIFIEVNKYARIHKRLMEKDPLTDSERKLFETLKGLKTAVDKEILQNSKLLENESYVDKMMMRLVVNQFKKEHKIDINTTDVKRINSIIVREYMNEYNGYVA